MNRTHIRLLPVILVLVGTTASVFDATASYAADSQPVQLLPNKFRIIGLFSSDRQANLREFVMQIPDVKLLGIDFQNAEATLAYDLAKLFPQARPRQIFSPEQIAERLDNLLRTASTSTFSVRLPSTTPKEKLVAVEIAIGILDCPGCCLGAYESVAKLDGVDRAIVDSQAGQVTAWIDADKTDRAALEAALTRARVTLKPKP